MCDSPATILPGVDTYEAIITRRSVAKTGTARPDRAAIERLLEAGVRAPSHHLTQPWRFVVLAGGALRALGDAWAEGATRVGKDAEAVRSKPLRAPVIISVICRPKVHLPKVVEVEEYYATGAAMQNVLLAAHDAGLAAMIRTGPAATFPEVRRYLGLNESESIAGFIYVGYPNEDHRQGMSRRIPAAEVTEWRGWNDDAG